jgi:hypothetical protein
MNTEKKILIIGFAAYTLMTIFCYFQPSQAEDAKVISFKDRNGFSKTLLGPKFVGHWTANSTGGLLNNRQGKAKASFYRFETLEWDQTFDLHLESNLYLSLHVMDPEFRDDHYIRIFQPLQTNNSTDYLVGNIDTEPTTFNNVWSFTGFNDFQDARNITFRGNMRFNPVIFNSEGVNKTALKSNDDVLDITLIDPNPNGLSLQIRLEYDTKNHIRQSLFYTYFLIAIAFVNYYGALNIFEQIAENTNYTRRLNKSSLILVCLQDCFIFLFNIQLGFNYLDTWNYIFVILVYFFLFCFVDYRLLLYIWRYQDTRTFDNMSEYQFRNKLYLFQMKIYFFIICYIYFMWKYFIDVNLVLLNSLVLLPQILHHITNSEPPFFETDFLVYFTASKYLIFLYLRGCPENILEVRSYYILPNVGLGIVLVNLAILYQQENYGSKFFIPKFMKKNEFDYFVEIKKAIAKTDVDPNAEKTTLNDSSVSENCCIICLSDLSQSHSKSKSGTKEEDEIQNKVLRRVIKRRAGQYLMMTPCKHLFHANCLGKWMEIKMECPHCRQPLPPVM